MKKGVVIGVCVASGIAVGSMVYAQSQMQQTVAKQVNSAVASLNEAEVGGARLTAKLVQESSALMESSGLIDVGFEDHPSTRFEIKYTVNHGVGALFKGANYAADVINSQLEGSDKTITDEFFGGSPVTIVGMVSASDLTGKATVPPVSLGQRSSSYLQIAESKIEFAFKELVDGVFAETDIAFSFPSISTSDYQGTLKVRNAALVMKNSLGKVMDGSAKLTLDELAISSAGSAPTSNVNLESLIVDTNTHISDELKTDFSVSVDKFDVSELGASFTDIGFGLRVNGLDGEFATQAINLAKAAAENGWSEARFADEVESAAIKRGDLLLAKNPTLEISHIKLVSNGQVAIDAKGVARLLSEKLPPKYLSVAFERGSQPDPSALLQAADVSFDAQLNDELAAMVAMFEPGLGQMLKQGGNKLSFKLDNGHAKLNGQSLM